MNYGIVMFSAAQERFRHKSKEQAHGPSLLDERLFFGICPMCCWPATLRGE